MKKIGLLIAVLATMVLAAQVDTWYWDGSQWVLNGATDPFSLCRAYAQYPTGGACNKEHWSFTFRAKASMAQWIEWSISGTEWKWRIRKVGPNLCDTVGYQAADCITFWLKSNYDVSMTFAGFGDLYNANSIDQYIEIWYAFVESNTPPPLNSSEWKSAAELNNTTIRWEDSQLLHDGISIKWWCKIKLTNCNSWCEYEDVDCGTVTITLEGMKPWIDPETGGFRTSL